MGRSEGLSCDILNSASSVSRIGERSTEAGGGRGIGINGEAGGDKIGRLPTGSPHSHFSKSTSFLGSGAIPNRISPVPGRVACRIDHRSSFGPSFLFAPCVVVPRMKFGRCIGSGQTSVHRSSKTPIPFWIRVMTEEGDILGRKIDSACTVSVVLRQTMSDLISALGRSAPETG